MFANRRGTDWARRYTIRVVTNDQIVVDTDIRNIDALAHHTASPLGDGFKMMVRAALQNKSGTIQFPGIHDRGQVDFRNIRIKELP